MKELWEKHFEELGKKNKPDNHDFNYNFEFVYRSFDETPFIPKPLFKNQNEKIFFITSLTKSYLKGGKR